MKNLLLKLLDKDYTYPKTKKSLHTYAKKYYKKLEYEEEVDIVMPIFNRLRETRRCISNLYNTIKTPFRLIVVDNSSAQETRNFLKKLSLEKANLELILLDKNTGAAGARNEALRIVKSKYVAFLDNDIYIMPGYIENLLEIIRSKDVVAVQSKVVFPNGLIQINRPYYEIDREWIVFSDKDIGKTFSDPSTELTEELDWVPSGATLWKSEVFKDYDFDLSLGTSYEDNDLSYRLSRNGYKFSNCPSAISIHYSSNFAPDVDNSLYSIDRYDKKQVWNSAKLFYKKHGLYFAYGDRHEYVNYIGFRSEKDYLNFIKA